MWMLPVQKQVQSPDLTQLLGHVFFAGILKMRLEVQDGSCVDQETLTEQYLCLPGIRLV